MQPRPVEDLAAVDDPAWPVVRSLVDEGLSIWPPPFTREGQDIGAASRRPVPITELLAFYDDAARQLGP